MARPLRLTALQITTARKQSVLLECRVPPVITHFSQSEHGETIREDK